VKRGTTIVALIAASRADQPICQFYETTTRVLNLKGITVSNSEQGASKWQPIETAPRDGTWILLFARLENYDKSAQGEMGVCRWERLDYHRESEDWAYGRNFGEHGFRLGFYDATHWMPLPEPPKD
jgi:hypothetical protein